VPIPPVQPLPIAAAHHPSSLHKLRYSIKAQSPFAVDSGINADPVAKQTPSHADISLSVQVCAEKEMASALHDALARTGKMGLELQARLHHEREIQTSAVENQRTMNLNLWRDDESQHHSVNFGVSSVLVSLTDMADYLHRRTQLPSCYHPPQHTRTFRPVH
jgi:hypothetical protein